MNYSSFLFEENIDKEHGEKHWVTFNRKMNDKCIDYFLNLRERIKHNGKIYHLRSICFTATRAAILSLILTHEDLPVKDKFVLMSSCLQPFYGFVDLPNININNINYKYSNKKSKPEPALVSFDDYAANSDFVFHIAFPDNYFIFNEEIPSWIDIPPRDFYIKRTKHQTWNFDRFINLECSFGGTDDKKCIVCNETLSHLITLPVLKGMPYTNLKKLKLSTCMGCVGWLDEPLFFKHDHLGQPYPSDYNYSAENENKSYSQVVIKPTHVFLSNTTKKWYSQKWVNSDHQNLNRIGGNVTWIQGKFSAKCPECDQPMIFLMQIDSHLPTNEGNRWMWGTGGMLYIFWCDKCKIDAQTLQCT